MLETGDEFPETAGPEAPPAPPDIVDGQFPNWIG